MAIIKRGRRQWCLTYVVFYGINGNNLGKPDERLTGDRRQRARDSVKRKYKGKPILSRNITFMVNIII